MSDSGVIDVVEKQFKWPLSGWPKDAHYKEVGARSFENRRPGLDARRGLDLLQYYEEQPQDRRIHAYIPL